MKFLDQFFSPHALLPRLRETAPPEQTRREDRTIAVARCILAAVSLVAIYLDPTEPSRFAALAYALLIIYVAYSVGVILASGAISGFSRNIRVALHAVDILWVATITWFTTGPNSPFFVFSLFVLLAAAYRWGFKETIFSAAAMALIPLVQAVAFESRGTWDLMGSVPTFDLNRLIMRVTWTLLMGVLLGFMAEDERLHRAEASLVARLLAHVQAARGLREAIEVVLGEFMRICDSSRACVVLREERTSRVFLWEGQRSKDGGLASLSLSEQSQQAGDAYFKDLPAHSLVVLPSPGNDSATRPAMLCTEAGQPQGQIALSWPAGFLPPGPMQTAMVISFEVKPEWSARLMIFDGLFGLHPVPFVRFHAKMLRELGPALQGLYLLRRLRWRAGAVERGRVARELHDGAIQSLIALEMEVDVMRRQLTGQPPAISENLTRIQNLLHQEILNLRELMEQVKPLEAGPREIVEQLAAVVDRFQQETGIGVTLVCPFEELPLPPHKAREISRILREALVNIRKHSQARHVVVRLTLESARLLLVIDDDGRGFPFSGRLTQQELDALRKGPLVIKERVRSIGGELVIESNPDRGARLEISIPR